MVCGGVLHHPVLSCPPRLAGRQADRLGSGFGKGGRNLSPGTNLLDWSSTEYQISTMVVSFLADKACLVGVAVFEPGPASEPPTLRTPRKDDVLCVLSGCVCVPRPGKARVHD